MNNEEKILEMLENLTTKADQIQTDQTEMKADISDLRQTVTRIAITQENVVLPNLQLLAEGMTPC